MNEAAIRDLLASDLSILEEGLQLLEIEQYIPPGTLGTRNFLDILAKDKAGHWVIIEVKKTDAAAREAAHEVFKYVEAVQRHFGVRSDEIRAIVAAVEWKELLVPFSRLLSETSISVEGVRVILDSTGKALEKVVTVNPVPVDKGRYLAPWHEINLYKDQKSLEGGIKTYDSSCKNKGIEDYVLVILRPAADFNETAAAATVSAIEQLRAALGNEFPDAPPASLIDGELDRYEAMIYFAPQIMSRAFCLSVLERDQDLLEEVLAFVELSDAEAELCTLHENVYDLEPRPHRDWFEIGYAAKFSHKLLEDECWKIERVLRRGTFARNSLLSDDAIVSELKGATGSSNQAFRREIQLDNAAHLASAKLGTGEALRTNSVWQRQVCQVLDEARIGWPTGSAKINVFNPSSGLFSLYFMATTEPSSVHMPIYQIAVSSEDGELVRIYAGLLVPTGEEPLSLQALLDKYYGGRMGQLMFLASGGFFETRDVDVMEDLGLAYRTFRLDDPEGSPKWSAWKDDRWKAFSPSIPFQPLQPWFDEHAGLLMEIVTAIGSRMHAGFHDMS